MEPIALPIVAAIALFLIFRRPGFYSPALVVEANAISAVAPGEDEEQYPETDRAPRPWLPLPVAAVTLARVALLVTLHA
jgi:hypothetical protein